MGLTILRFAARIRPSRSRAWNTGAADLAPLNCSRFRADSKVRPLWVRPRQTPLGLNQELGLATAAPAPQSPILTVPARLLTASWTPSRRGQDSSVWRSGCAQVALTSNRLLARATNRCQSRQRLRRAQPTLVPYTRLQTARRRLRRSVASCASDRYPSPLPNLKCKRNSSAQSYQRLSSNFSAS
jgi:hypothetical protein